MSFHSRVGIFVCGTRDSIFIHKCQHEFYLVEVLILKGKKSKRIMGRQTHVYWAQNRLPT